MKLDALLDIALLEEMMEARYVRRQVHPTLPFEILNYTAAAQYDRVWNDVTRQCRGLIIDPSPVRRWSGVDVVSRPWPKFFNYGEHEEPVKWDAATQRKVYPESDSHHALDLLAPVEVTDKMDGSLGILYPGTEGWAIATRGSFTSEQAIKATQTLERMGLDTDWPQKGLTYLFEIVYPGNRIVVNYGARDELVLLGAVDVETGETYSPRYLDSWPGARVETFEHKTLADALDHEPRPNAEGLVVRYLDGSNVMVKIKQDDYVALHRILTGTNARNVWEYAAVKACSGLIEQPKHWATYLGIGPQRAAELLELGDAWLEDVPDEFHAWVRQVIGEAQDKVIAETGEAVLLVEQARTIENRQERYELVKNHRAAKEILRIVDGRQEEMGRMLMRAWRNATPPPTSPFERSEDIA